MLPLKTLTPLSFSLPLSSSSSSHRIISPLSLSSPSSSRPGCSLGSQKLAADAVRFESASGSAESASGNSGGPGDSKHLDGREGSGERKTTTISGIHVPRQKYISVPKAELLEAVLAMFEAEEDAAEFARFAKFLDLILHAEHKELLEEMRTYYLSTHQEDKETISCPSIPMNEAVLNGQHITLDGLNGSENSLKESLNMEDEWTPHFPDSWDLRSLFKSSPWTASSSTASESRVAFATHFQHSFMKLLRDAQFQELSAQELLLTYALNTDYLLTLPIYVDWKKASESNVIIFRRGYATERQKGLLLVEKLDYLQSKLLQKVFFSLSTPLKNISKWLSEALKSLSGMEDLQIWNEKVKQWLKEQYSPENYLSFEESSSDNKVGSDTNTDLPIWIAAQRAVPRYRGLLSPVGPRGRLIRKLLTWTGLIPSLPEASNYCDIDMKYSENYLRPNFLPRITLTNIWEPASRESCGGNVWETLKASIAILFRRSTLQEPAFQELILLYTDESTQSRARDEKDMLPLQLKIYEKIPIPDLPVVFPHKKLSFRILDTVRLDIATIIGLLAYIVNYKFENIVSSPSAILLDVVAVSALIIYVFRVVLGYKQTWDRYQYKEAVLVYALLLCPKKYQISCRKTIGDACEHFMYDKFKEKIEMPINKAMDTLVRLGLVMEFPMDEDLNVVALSCSEACEILRKRWDSLLEQNS
ncbi:uncharacterized protein LOC109727187 isoform X2 [Ananas comosus]|uniref:Uncharacterized protein LOC109727187 isoform X2 n=1 Tax=Ananas comosus TaxID=4615 RepID=A0A6P5GY52_ANACO|nr:uncharacterized protein LOC109727187 isoform X2 [Ananas comosus]